jgi:hypothetical protein
LRLFSASRYNRLPPYRSHGDKKVSDLSAKGQLKKMWEEIEKCIPLCANCHRIYHWMEKEGEKDE